MCIRDSRRVDARAHRFDKVDLVRDPRLVRQIVVFCSGIGKKHRIGGEHFAATYLYPTVVAIEFNTLLRPVERLFGHHYAVVVKVSEVVVVAVSRCV